MIRASEFDGRGYEPPYPTDTEEAEAAERERCAVIAETMEVRLDLSEWQTLTKKEISKRVAIQIAEAIRASDSA